ncbi:penicillin-binding transpeptidase domain-containing protein [Pontibacter sp. BT731]|uniref:penicillin-binding transpeptidase domain-containing protein n=1 Tax=Pontibacter coccineus TaxID=3063328 RepID=UPI0026E37F4D|nr:penicillin-binding transpeptidase domain-containing protein [Pontibacter sp. BT731]MDO6389729.1 penicillin-binding transpeptidase domain-containing protein [Pontibacter sp. BT731]
MRLAIALLLIFISLSAYGQVDLNTPFQDCNIKGSITLYDYQAKKWTYSNVNDSHLATLPASTFKIINTLIALETGAVADENEVIKWPGETDTVKYGYRPDIYHDMNLREAFQKSAGWVYVELAKKIGKAKYKDLLTKSNYGNADVSIQDPDFWNFGNFAISPASQIEVLIGVYEETLPFSKRSFKILKDIMIEEQTDSHTLRAKTGWTRDGGKDTGWWVGYVEKEDNVYFFATRLIKDRNTPNPDFGSCRKEITRSVFRQLDVL